MVIKSRKNIPESLLIAIFAIGTFAQHTWTLADSSASPSSTTTVIGAASSNPSRTVISSAGEVSDELSASELADNFFSFSIAVVPNRSVQLLGMIYDQCYNDFEISTRQDQQGDVGYVITDTGGKGRSCVKTLKAQGAICGRTASCSPLSAKSGSRIDFSNAGDIKIGIMHRLTSQDPNDPNQNFEDLPNTPISHTSAMTLLARQREAAQERQRKLMESALSQFTSCRHSMDEIDNIAQHALDVYSALKHLTTSEYDKKEQDLQRAKLKILSNQIAKVNATKPDSGDIDDLRAKIQDFANENPSMAESAAKLDFDLAQKIVLPKNAAPSAYDLASQIIGDAQSIDNLSDDSVSRLQNYQNQLAVGKMQATALSGNVDAFTFMPSYMSLMQQMEQNLQTSCSNMTTGISQDCIAARNNFIAARNIPQTMYEAQQQKARLQMQIQQSLMAPTGMQGGMQGGMPMMQNPMNVGSINGFLNPAFVNPLMGAQPQQQLF